MNYITTAAFGAVLLSAASMSQAATVDFNGFATGASINSVDFGGGITATVTTVSNRNGGTNQAAVFDTNAYTGNDTDLQSDFARASDTNDTKDLGKVLVIAGPAGPSGPNGPTPDDDAQGGVVTFIFNQLVNFQSVDYADTEAGGNRLIISFFDMNGGLLPNTTTGNLITGDSKFDTYAVGVDGVKSIAFDFGGSGALDNLSVSTVPVPASLPLLVGGFGLMAFMRRRRKS